MVAAALDELADIASDALPPPPLPVELPTAAAVVAGGGESDAAGISIAVGGADGAPVATAAELWTAAARTTTTAKKTDPNGAVDWGTQSGRRACDRRGCPVARLLDLEASLRGTGAGGEGGGGRVHLRGEGELRRLVRSVRALAEAGAGVASDRDRAVSEVWVRIVEMPSKRP